MIKIACTNTMLNGETMTQQAEMLAELGFDGIAVMWDIDDWNDRKTGELLELEKRTGVHVCEFLLSGRYYGHLMDTDPFVRAEARKQYKETIHICNELGAVTEMEYEYGYEGLPLFHPYQQMSGEDEKALAEVACELSAELKGNAKLLIEPINRYEARYLNCMKDVDHFIRKNQIPKLGILADTFHMSIEESNLSASILQYGDLIRHVHLGDNNRLLPGEGSLDWKKIFAALKSIEYDGYVNLECAVMGNLQEKLSTAKKFIRDLVGNECAL